MFIRFAELKRFQPLDKVILYSLESSLYQVAVLINGIEHQVYLDERRLVGRSPLQVEALLDGVRWKRMVIRQNGAYDEMIGLDSEPARSRAEIPYSGRNFN